MGAIVSLSIGLELVILLLMQIFRKKCWGYLALFFCIYPLGYIGMVMIHAWWGTGLWPVWLLASAGLIVGNMWWVRRVLRRQVEEPEDGYERETSERDRRESSDGIPPEKLFPADLTVGVGLPHCPWTDSRYYAFLRFYVLCVLAVYCAHLFYWLYVVCELKAMNILPILIEICTVVLILVMAFCFPEKTLSEPERTRFNNAAVIMLWPFAIIYYVCNYVYGMAGDEPGLRHYEFFSDAYYVVKPNPGDSLRYWEKYDGDGTLRYQGGYRHERGLVRHGWGKVYYDNGYYEGEFVSDGRTGRGCYYWKDKDWCDGIWERGNREGNGVYFISNGTSYVGLYHMDEKHGPGCYYYTDGTYRLMNYRNGKETLTGDYVPLDSGVYVGLFTDGEYTGRGRYYYAEGGYYEGNFMKGRFSGSGRLFDYNGKLIQSGKWRDRLPAECEYMFKGKRIKHDRTNTDSPSGKKNNKASENPLEQLRETLDRIVDPKYMLAWDEFHIQGNLLKEGAWQADKNIGNRKNFRNGDLYEGGWKNGRPHGVGTYVTNDGHKYKGEFRNGELNGFAVHYKGAVVKYYGQWKNGKTVRK